MCLRVVAAEANVSVKAVVVDLLKFPAPYSVMVKVPMSHVRIQPIQTDYYYLKELLYHKLMFEEWVNVE